MKHLFKKAYWNGKDPWLALLDHRDTPTEGVDASPAQRLMSRRTCTLVPTLSLYSTLKSFKFCIEAQVEKEKSQVLPWSSGKAVTRTSNWTRSHNGYHRLCRDHSWKHGTYIEKLSDKSFVTQSGDSTLRRNRQFLKPTEPQDKGACWCQCTCYGMQPQRDTPRTCDIRANPKFSKLPWARLPLWESFKWKIAQTLLTSFQYITVMKLKFFKFTYFVTWVLELVRIITDIPEH